MNRDVFFSLSEYLKENKIARVLCNKDSALYLNELLFGEDINIAYVSYTDLLKQKFDFENSLYFIKISDTSLVLKFYKIRYLIKNIMLVLDRTNNIEYQIQEIAKHTHDSSFMLSKIFYTIDKAVIFLSSSKIATTQENLLCCGCNACLSICPTGALSSTKNSEGSFCVKVNLDKCIHCQRCTYICPTLNPKKNPKVSSCYAFNPKDRIIKEKSTTAGAFYFIAKRFIENGGYVVGAAWDFKNIYEDEIILRHKIVSKEEDLFFLQKSKYTQSYISQDLLNQIHTLLQQNNKVLFSGLPCQVNAITSLFGKKFNNLLYTIDLLCGTTPSQDMLKRSFSEIHNNKPIKKINFRFYNNDYPSGLNLKVTYTDNSYVIHTHDKDPYFSSFLPCIIRPTHCDYCKFVSLDRAGDVTLGDFHSIEKFDSRYNSTVTGVCIPNTPKGQMLSQWFLPKVSTVSKKNVNLINNIGNVTTVNQMNLETCKRRDRFFSMLDQGYSFVKTSNNIKSNYYDVALVGLRTSDSWDILTKTFTVYRQIKKFKKSVLVVIESQDCHNNKDNWFYNNIYSNEIYMSDLLFVDHNFNYASLNNCVEIFVLCTSNYFKDVSIKENLSKSCLSYIQRRKKKVSFLNSFGDHFLIGDSLRAKFSFYLQNFDSLVFDKDLDVTIAKEWFACDGINIAYPILFLYENIFKWSFSNQNGICIDLKFNVDDILEIILNKYKFTEMLKLENAKNTFKNILDSMQKSDIIITDNVDLLVLSVLAQKKIIFFITKNNENSLLWLKKIYSSFALHDMIHDKYSSYLDLTNAYLNLNEVKNMQINLSMYVSQLVAPLTHKRANDVYDILIERIEKLEKQVQNLANNSNINN